jgi:Zn-dependent protease
VAAEEAPARRASGARLGRVAGVPVVVAPSWFLFAAFIAVSLGSSLAEEHGRGAGYTAATTVAVALGLSVLLHELGHCLVARLLGLPVRSITVTFMAGLTEVVEEPQTPAREYAVAVVGPIVSVLLCGLCLLGAEVAPAGSLTGDCLVLLGYVNGSLAVFNLLPGLPLDGGRVVRAVAWHVGRDPERATRVAARAGQVLAVVVLPLLLVVVVPARLDYSPSIGGVLFSALASAFVYAGATAALRRSQVLSRLPSVSVVALARPAIRVPASLPLSEAVRRAQEAGARGVVVVDSADRLEAVVTEAAVLATPEERRPWVPVGSVAKRLVEGMHLDPALAGEPLLEALRACPTSEYVTTDPATGEVRVLSVSDVAKAVGS